MKRKLFYVFSLAALTIGANLAAILVLVFRGEYSDPDFGYTVVVFSFISLLVFGLCKSIYSLQVTRGEQSIRKLALCITFMCWIDLLLLSLLAVEGMKAEQNPFTNPTVLLVWSCLSILAAGLLLCERRYGNLQKS